MLFSIRPQSVVSRTSERAVSSALSGAPLDVMPNILSHLCHNWHRETTQHLVEMGIVTKKQYDEHWKNLCRRLESPHNYLFQAGVKVDYGMLYHLLSVLKETSYSVDVASTDVSGAINIIREL